MAVTSSLDPAWVGSVRFGETAADYGKFRQGYPAELLDRLGGMGIGSPGQRVLDVGTGTGALARGMAARGADVTGVDPSAALVAEAKALASGAGLRAQFYEGSAEATGLEAGAYDAVTAAQCWHWFDDAAALAEARRVLRPGGRLAIVHMDWLPLPGGVVHRTESLILKHNPAWGLAGGDGLYPRYFSMLTAAGWRGLEAFVKDVHLPFSHQAWRGRIRASAGVGATLSPEGVQAFDDALKALLHKEFPEEILQVPHRLFAVAGLLG